jgi:methyl acetate hydrolase
MTSIAAMQCVERGLIGLDDDVAELLPEVGQMGILTGFDAAGKPMLKKRQKAITLR